MNNIFIKNKPLKTLVNLYRGNYIKLFISFIFFVIKSSPVWVMPIVVANLINLISSSGDNNKDGFILNISIMLILIITNIPANLICARYRSLAIRYVESNIRSGLIKKLQVLSIPYHKHLQSGKLQSKVLRDVESITNLSRQIGITVLPIIISIVVTFSITATKNKYVALFFLAAIPVAFFIIVIFGEKIINKNIQFRKNIEEMSSSVAQMVEMVPITRAHALENLEIERVNNKIHKVKKSGYLVDILNEFFGSCGWASFQIMQLGCLIFTGYLAMTKRIEVGDIVLYQSYFMSLLGEVNALINVYPDLVRGFDAINSVGEIFFADDIEDSKDKKEIKNVEGNYKFNNVYFKYEDGQDFIIDDFNMEIDKGETIAFVGESGGGKTTLLDLIVGFLNPTKGQILLDGQDMQILNLKTYRKHIAVVPQNTILFSGSIRENITYGVDVSEEKLTDIIEAACLTEVIEKLPDGLETSVGEHGGMLSGGQKQRIAIARALIRDPKVIILDEATSALDNKAEVHVQKAMENLIKGRTTFIVAHRLSTIKDADRIVVIEGGKIIEEGPYEKLMEERRVFYKLINGLLEEKQ
ncbi:MAG: ABC transporter ATP-binding protein [Clostridium butyricum]|nr:ABC transporter ATP-binding protein [Clostridium butyricum]